MEDKQLLELILGKLNSIETNITEMKSDIKEIKSVQSQHTQKLESIHEQTGKNTELKSVVDELVKDRELIKRILSN